MKKIWSNYKQTIILLGALIIGAIVGLVWGEKAAVLSPFGDLFMNLMFVIIVPLIFLTITTSIAKIQQPKRLGKVIKEVPLIYATKQRDTKTGALYCKWRNFRRYFTRSLCNSS